MLSRSTPSVWAAVTTESTCEEVPFLVFYYPRIDSRVDLCMCLVRFVIYKKGKHKKSLDGNVIGCSPTIDLRKNG